MTSLTNRVLKHAPRALLRTTAMAVLGLVAIPSDAHAFGSLGNEVDAFCTTNNRVPANPYNGNCQLCHGATTQIPDLKPAPADASRSGNYGFFCSDTVSNLPPDGTITAPANGSTFAAGATVTFRGSGGDPEDGNAVSYAWDFAGLAPNAATQNPQVNLTNTSNAPATRVVRLTVRDSAGLADPSPATITITVNAASGGGGGGGGGGGNPPPTTCTDADGDGFSPEGAFCGPVDSDDQAAAINPGVYEVCDDTIDNDSDGLTDLADEECESCDNRSPRDQLFYGDCRFADAGGGGGGGGGGGSDGDRRDTELKAKWESGDDELKVRAKHAPAGGTVKVGYASDGAVVGTAQVDTEDEYKWKLDVEGLALRDVPCQIRVVYADGSTEVVDVEDAPTERCR